MKNAQNRADKSEIAELVRSKIKNILCDQHITVNDTDDLVHDLKICSDDLSFTFIGELEAELSVYGTQDEWLDVYSVGDAIDLLCSLKAAGRTMPPREPNLWGVLKSRFKI